MAASTRSQVIMIGAALTALATTAAHAQTITYHLHREAFADPIAATGRQTAATGLSKASELTIAVPTAAAGHLLLAQIAIEGFGESDIVCTPGGWTVLRRDNNSSSTAQAIFWRIAAQSEPVSYTWRFRANTASCGASSNTRQVLAVGGIVSYRGIDVSAPIFGHGGGVASNTTINAPPVPNAPFSSRVVWFFSNNKEFAISSAGSSSTPIYAVSVPKPPGLREKPSAAAADAAHASNGTTAAVTASNGGNSANWIAQTVVLMPPPGPWRMTTALPDSPSIVTSSQNLRDKPGGDFLIREFATEPGVPNSAGTIPAGSAVSLTLWMRKSAGGGAMRARARIGTYDAPTGTITPLCGALGEAMLTTTLSAHTVGCKTSEHVVLTSTDRFYAWVGVNTTGAAIGDVAGQLALEGSPDGEYDSRLVLPEPIANPTITTISPLSGVPGTTVTIGGVNFGATPGGSEVTFNGAPATATAWSATSITAAVPPAATSGPVLVTVAGLPSNAIPFSVLRAGTLAGRVTRASDGVPVPGAVVEVLQGATVIASGSTAVSGEYSLPDILAGTYDLRVSSASVTATRPGITVLPGLTTVTDIALAEATPATGPVTYAYDDLNRLIGVTNAAGESAGYEYDAVGNLLSINRYGAGAVAILGFSPQTGAVGTTVVITGSGFSTSASANAVTFNGVVATVVSASSTEIVTTVPVAAETGLIAVSSPTGTAASSVPFAVVSQTSAPTISGLSPAIAKAGTPLVITGANFALVPHNNRPRVNVTFAPVVAAATNFVSTAVPHGATSGHVSLSTPHGTAVSSGVLFVPPFHYTASDVAFTGVLTSGEALDLILGNPTQIALIAFDGAGGDRIAFTIAGPFANQWLFGPRGELPLDFSGGLRTATLPETGTYTLALRRVREGSSEPTTVTLTALPLDASASISVDGPPVTVALDTVGQRARLTFNGVAGQRLGLKMTGGSAQFVKASVLDARGNAMLIDLHDNWAFFAHESFSDVLLPATGAYTILVYDPSPVGTAAFSLSTAPPALKANLETGRGPVTVTTTQPGENARVTFAGIAGTHVALILTEDSLQGLVTIFRPSGTTLVWPRLAFMDGTLPETGTYTILLDAYRERTGSTTLQLVTPPTDLAGTVAIDGSPASVAIPTPGQNARLTFTGSTGQHVALVSSGHTFPRVRVSVLDSANRVLSEHDSINGPALHLLALLPADEVYSIRIDPFGDSTGEITLTLSSLPEVRATLVIGASPVAIAATAVGQRVRLTFFADVGQRVSLGMTGVFLQAVSVLSPSGSAVPYTGGDPIELGVLAQNGAYTIHLAASQPGSTFVRLYDVPPDVTGGITPNGSPVTVTLTTPGQHGHLTFEGVAGRRVSVSTTAGTFTNGALIVGVVAPSGLSVGSALGMGGAGFLDAVMLPETGAYALRLDPFASSTGSISITLNEFADLTGELTPGAAPATVTIASPGQNAVLTFTAIAGRPIIVEVTGNTVGTITLEVSRIEGSLVQATTFGGDHVMSIPSAPSTGTYVIHIDPAAIATGVFNVKVTSSS